MRNRSRTASFRRSVISVAAAFAAAPACSVDHDARGESIDEINPPSCDEGSLATGCVAPVDCHGAEPPERGAPCATDGEICDYDACSRDDGVAQAVCVEGAWELITGTQACNPPALPECPEGAPEDGTPCSLGSDEVCSYGDCGGPSLIDAQCDDGVWTVYENSCNPPLIDCPFEQPQDGDACDGSLVDTLCNYGDCGGDVPTVNAICTPQEVEEGAPRQALWVVTDTTCSPPLPECPETAPEDESSCDDQEGNWCTWSTDPALCADFTWNVQAICSLGVWQVRTFEECQGPWKD